MTKAQAQKFEGKWKQVKAENMDAVMEALGQRWVTRKVAAMMDVHFEFEAQDDGIKTALKTKLKNIDTKLLYNGVTHTKGLADDEDVEVTISFDAKGNLTQVSKITSNGTVVNTTRYFEIVGAQMVITQECGGKKGTRTFDKE